MSSITPVSLFTHITLVTATSSRTSLSNEASHTTPFSSTSSKRCSPPSCATSCAAARTALCSIGDVTTAFLPLSCNKRQTQSTAVLSPSVPHELKETSSGCAPKHAASRSRASSSAKRAASAWSGGTDDALDGLYVQEPPHPKLLFVRHQTLGQKPEIALRIACIDLPQLYAPCCEQASEGLWQTRLIQRFFDHRVQRLLRAQVREILRIAEPGNQFDGAELRALAAGRCTKISTKL